MGPAVVSPSHSREEAASMLRSLNFRILPMRPFLSRWQQDFSWKAAVRFRPLAKVLHFPERRKRGRITDDFACASLGEGIQAVDAPSGVGKGFSLPKGQKYSYKTEVRNILDSFKTHFVYLEVALFSGSISFRKGFVRLWLLLVREGSLRLRGSHEGDKRMGEKGLLPFFVDEWTNRC